MKKFLPYIFTLVILANILAPISATFTNKSVSIGIQKAEAVDKGPKLLEIRAEVMGQKNTTNQWIDIPISVTWYDIQKGTSSPNVDTLQFFDILIKGNGETDQPAEYHNRQFSDFDAWPSYEELSNTSKLTIRIAQFKGKSFSEYPETDFEISVKVWQQQKPDYKNLVNSNTDTAGYLSATITAKTLSAAETKAGVGRTNNDSYSFNCILNPLNILPGFATGTWAGCFTGIFDIVFWISSKIFAGAGLFFDWTLGYSLDSNSYRSAFVTEGWGMVRDICNVFFIFILLYVAFATVLNLHGFKTKETIVNVVIIGLLINFSLFATQVIIDTSNILARVFYNNVQVNTQGENNITAGINTGVNKNLTSNLGEKHLSEAIVNKFEPQKLLQNASQFDVDDPNSSDKSNGISAGTYLFITFLMIVMCIIGTIVFLSVGLIFITRVIGLWLAMILVPFTFFSYTLPAMQDIEMVGWKKWWPETLKLAFLAPVFMFFLYLILQFLESGLGLLAATDKSGFQFVLSIVIPFAFLMVLLWKAKGIASKMSGELGQSITGALTTIGGLALGGAALGTAVLGRKVIGNTMARASRGQTATQKYESGTATGLAKVTGFIGSKLGLGRVFGNTYDINTRQVSNGIGGKLNEKQKHVEHIDHDRHAIDSIKDKRYKDVPIDKLSGTQMQNVKEDYIKENRGRFAGEEDEKYRTAHGLTKNDALNATQIATIQANTDAQAATEFNEKLTNASKTVDGFTRAFTRTNTGTYDVRNLSQTKADKREDIFTKISAGLIAGIALGVRTGLKSGLNVNHGSGQNDFLKDLGNTFTEAMKSVKINVKVEESHGTGGGDAHKSGGH